MGMGTMKFLRLPVLSSLVFLAGAAAVAHAQSAVDSGSIVDALKQQKKPLTRSITAQPQGMEEGDKSFLNAMRGKTRGISFEERKQLATIVKTYDLPSIDLEIYFDYDSDKVTARARPDLVELGKALRNDALKDAVFMVSGHTDAAGSDDYNLDLSERRARSVTSFVIDRFGISKDRLIAVGYGEEQLKTPQAPEAAENRRVTVVNMSK